MNTLRMSREEAEEKAKVLVTKMTVDEKISQLEYDAKEIAHLNIPEYNYWNEALHGVARAGTATVFPQSIGLAAMFSPELLNKVGETVSTEARAKYNEFSKHGDRDIYKGLTFWSPNVNIFRDPRWGRGHETYGEDPYLTSRNGVAYIEGLQGDGKYLKLAACAKHFAVHSGPEGVRHGFNVNVSKKDLYETYLPAFKAAVQEGHVESVMAAYNAVNGEPAPVSRMLLNNILRSQWQFQGHVVSDYGAEEDVAKFHHYTTNDTETIVAAIKAGCDLCAGHIADKLHEGLAQNLITEAEIDASVERLMVTRILLGMNATDNEYDSIPYEENDSQAHHELALQATYKSFVLLKNTGFLPMNKDQLNSVAVIGPTADSKIILQGNYAGTASNYTTILDGIRQGVKPNTRINYAEGCHLFKDRVEPLAKADDRVSEAIIAAEHSDVVIMCLGLDSTIEGEEGDAGNAYAAGDKTDLSLPGHQQQLLEQVLTVGKPVILLITAGSALTFNGAEKNPNLVAILDVWYPGALGGQAVADVLFGKVSPSGKLPVTFYQSTDDLPDFTDYSMKDRTYRYMHKPALYPFGYGLTYSKIKLTNLQISQQNKRPDHLAVDVGNVGNFATDEVVQVYGRNLTDPNATPNPKLIAFQRVTLAKGAIQNVQIDIPETAYELVDNEGKTYQSEGNFELFVGIGQPDQRTEELTGVKAIKTEFWL